MHKAIEIVWAGYDALKYGKTQMKYGDFEMEEYATEDDDRINRSTYFFQDTFLDSSKETLPT